MKNETEILKISKFETQQQANRSSISNAVEQIPQKCMSQIEKLINETNDMTHKAKMMKELSNKRNIENENENQSENLADINVQGIDPD